MVLETASRSEGSDLSSSMRHLAPNMARFVTGCAYSSTALDARVLCGHLPSLFVTQEQVGTLRPTETHSQTTHACVSICKVALLLRIPMQYAVVWAAT